MCIPNHSKDATSILESLKQNCNDPNKEGNISNLRFENVSDSSDHFPPLVENDSGKNLNAPNMEPVELIDNTPTLVVIESVTNLSKENQVPHVTALTSSNEEGEPFFSNEPSSEGK